MSKNYRSDVYSYEIDDSFSARVIANTYPIFFGAANRGPTEPQFISDFEDAVAMYGIPNASISKWLYDAKSFFDVGSGAWFRRVTPADATYGGALVQNKEVALTRTLGVFALAAGNPEDVDLTSAGTAVTLDDNLFYIYAWGQGSYSERLRIEITSENLVAPALSTGSSVAITPTSISSLLPAETYNYVVTAYNVKGETVASNQVTVTTTSGQAVRLTLAEAVDGAAGYRVFRKLAADSAFAFLGTIARGTLDYYDYGRVTPTVGTTPPVAATIPVQNVFTLSVFDESVSLTVARETFEVSLMENVSSAGAQTELEETINTSSKLIRVISNGPLLSEYPTMYSMDPFHLAAGSSGSAISDSNIVLALADFEDDEKYPASLISDCGYTQVTVQRAIQALVSKRKYMIGMLNVPSNQQQAQDAINYRAITLGISDNAMAIFTNDHKVLDPYNNIQLYVPPTGKVLAAIAYTDQVANQAFSPAGFRRGVALNTLGLRHNYSKDERDLLAASQVNYYATERNYGAVLREAYTLQADYSSLSYISVRRIIHIAEENTERALRIFLQEPNDELTALQLETMLRDYYQLLVDGRMISRFDVTTRTSAADVQLGNRRVYTIIEPLLPTVRIHHTTIISKQGADFSETLERLVAA